MLEIVFAGKGLLFHYEINEKDDVKKRILETLLLLPIKEILPKAFEKMLTEVFSLNEIEKKKAIDCYLQWLSVDEVELPHYQALGTGYEYWKLLENDNNGWKFLSKAALLFANTLPSESSVERDFSKGKYRTGERRFNSSLESMDAELLL
jgi:hypothetical protein